MFELKFETEHKHWKEYNFVAQQRCMGWLMLSPCVVIAIASVVIIGLLDTQEQFDLDHRSMVSGFAATFFSTLLVYSVYYDQLLKRFLKNPGTILGPHQMQLHEEGFLFSGNQVQSTFGWNLVEGVSSHKSILVLWLEPSVGIIVPKSAFQTTAKIARPTVGQKTT
jgi:hypothetical protein